MSTLPNGYWRMFDDENKNLGMELSRRIGGAGVDACEELKQPLNKLFAEWRKRWSKAGLLPKRKKTAAVSEAL